MAKIKGKVGSKKDIKKAGSKVTPAEEKDTASKSASKTDTKSKVDKKKAADKPAANVGMYIHGSKLVQISWEKETDKTVKANGEFHKDSPLKKDRIFNLDTKTMEAYNKINDQLQALELEQRELLAKAGNKFN